MRKPPMIPGQQPQGVTPDVLDSVVAKALPLTSEEKYGFGAIMHPATNSVYFVARHKLDIHPTVVRVPLSQIIKVALGITATLVVPSLEMGEQQAEQANGVVKS